MDLMQARAQGRAARASDFQLQLHRFTWSATRLGVFDAVIHAASLVRDARQVADNNVLGEAGEDGGRPAPEC